MNSDSSGKNSHRSSEEESAKKSRFSNWTGKNSWKGGVLALTLSFGMTGAMVIDMYGELVCGYSLVDMILIVTV